MGDMAYFPAYFSYARTMEGLTDAQFGHVMRAAIEYAENGTIPELDALERMSFAFIKEDIDRANERYRKVCEANKRNARKRWKADPESTDDATACDRMRSDANECVRTDSYATHATACDGSQSKSNSKRKAKEKENAKGTSTCAGGGAVDGGRKSTGFIKPTEEEVAAYCAKMNYTHVDAAEFVAYYDDRHWIAGDGEPMKNWKSVVRGWEQRNRDKPAPRPAASSFDTDDFFDAALMRTYGDNWKLFKEGGEQG